MRSRIAVVAAALLAAGSTATISAQVDWGAQFDDDVAAVDTWVQKKITSCCTKEVAELAAKDWAQSLDCIRNVRIRLEELRTGAAKATSLVTIRESLHFVSRNASDAIDSLARFRRRLAPEKITEDFLRADVQRVDAVAEGLVAGMKAVRASTMLRLAATDADRPVGQPAESPPRDGRAPSAAGATETPPTPSTGGRLSVAVQCSGITAKGTRCKRKTTDPSGRCWQHK